MEFIEKTLLYVQVSSFLLVFFITFRIYCKGYFGQKGISHTYSYQPSLRHPLVHLYPYFPVYGPLGYSSLYLAILHCRFRPTWCSYCYSFHLQNLQRNYPLVYIILPIHSTNFILAPMAFFTCNSQNLARPSLPNTRSCS